MAKFRKKPVIVQAEQWFPGKDVPGVFLHQPPDAVLGGRGHGEQRLAQEPYAAVRTIQGVVTRVCPGDWIITESNGVNHYPCQADVFASTYDLVSDQ